MIQYTSQKIEDYVPVSPQVFKADGHLIKNLGMSLTDFRRDEIWLASLPAPSVSVPGY